MTFWDQVNLSRWGAYLARVEERGVRKAHALAGTPSAGIDLGCGSGRWSSLLAGLGWRMTCVDVDEESIAVCRRNLPSASHILASVNDTAIPAESNSVSLILCVEVPLLEQPWFLPESTRVLKANGLMAGVWLNSASWRSKAWAIKVRLRPRPGGTTYYHAPYGTFKKQLVSAGFRIEYEEGYCWPPFGRASNSPMIPLFARAEKLLGLNRWINRSPWVFFIARKTS